MDESQYKVSGNYTYRVINEAQKEIEIRKIDTTESVLNILAEIDGDKVVSLGYSGKAWEDDGIQYFPIAGTAEKNVTELIIPKGVKEIGNYAFNDYDKLIVHEDVEVIAVPADAKINNLIINGADTKVQKETYPERDNMDCKLITTVPDAKCIKWAKKNKVNYIEMPQQSKVKVKKNKVGKKLVYSWNKTKLVKIKTTFKKNGKAVVKKSKLKTAYAVYVKNKAGKYEKVKIIKKNKWTTKKKGTVKVIAVPIEE